MQANKYSMTAEQQKIFQSYIKTVPYTIYHYFNYQKCKEIGFPDIMNAGYLGLVYAIKTFDETLGKSFTSWAIKNVRYGILRYLNSIKKGAECQSIEDIRESELRGKKVGTCTTLLKLDYTTPHIERIDNAMMVNKIHSIAKEILPTVNYEIYNLHFIQGFTPKEISTQRGCSKTYIHEAIKIAISKIQKELREQGLLE